MNYEEIFEERGDLYARAHQIAPAARRHEGEALLRWLEPRQDETVVVTAAGGGFDAVSIEQSVAPAPVHLICVEPSPKFAALIPERFEVHRSPFDSIPLRDGAADAVVNFAALHHIERRGAALQEWRRVLRPGGRLVVADVEAGQANGEFLNTVVDRFTPGGHRGAFLEPGELEADLIGLGFSAVREALERYTWDFADRDEMLSFCRHLFGMVKATPGEIAEGIERYLGTAERPGGSGLSFPWSLRFCRGVKQGS